MSQAINGVIPSPLFLSIDIDFQIYEHSSREEKKSSEQAKTWMFTMLATSFC